MQQRVLPTPARLRLPPARLNRTALLAVCVPYAATLAAQALPVIHVRPEAASLDEGFTRIGWIRELGDGRILVADTYERRLVVADFNLGRVEQIGRLGQGPGEFRGLDGLFALAGDSTLLEDRRSRRWIIMDGARVVATVNATLPGGQPGPAVYGADTNGRILDILAFAFHRTPGIPGLAIRPNADSLLVLVRSRPRVSTTSGHPDRLDVRVDTVARLRGRGGAQTIAYRAVIPGGQPIQWVLDNPLAVDEQAILFRDGWIAFAFSNPYHVDWLAPGGKRVRGAALPFAHVRVDDRVKRGVIAREWPKVEPPFGPNDFPAWPEALPAFPTNALLAAPDGRLLVRRTLNPLAPNTSYDIVDREARLVARLTLPARARVVAFGARSVYVVERDEDDIERVRRHPWP